MDRGCKMAAGCVAQPISHPTSRPASCCQRELPVPLPGLTGSVGVTMNQATPLGLCTAEQPRHIRPPVRPLKLWTIVTGTTPPEQTHSDLRKSP
ncbi:hypothetical protein NDU88_006733 [Pleurodeles waltl]|uniref:Uncharacterized protein n=1 Tax=Pleurodeles waltl TaxID=8319 RepID=A0AAV7WFN4_PLEWA|nr:hypothetical protein NDU88_006733 [Pleurodeles waltl]